MNRIRSIGWFGKEPTQPKPTPPVPVETASSSVVACGIDLTLTRYPFQHAEPAQPRQIMELYWPRRRFIHSEHVRSLTYKPADG